MSDIFLYFLLCFFLLTGLENFGMVSSFISRRMKCRTLEIPNAKVRYKSRYRIAKIRCNAGYLSVGGDRRLTCIRGQWTGRKPTCISPGCDDLSIANGDVLSLYEGAMMQFYCHHGYELIGSSSLHCDGEQWNDTMLPQCRIPHMNSDHLECSFENENLCGWKQDHLDTHDWNWATAGHTSFIGTLGPLVDHTFEAKNGHFIMVDSSLTWSSRDSARLFSPILAFPEHTPACVVFFYYMYGTTSDAALRVYVRPESEPFEIILPQLEAKHSLLREWQMAYIYLEDEDDFFQIVFEAKGGDDHFNDIYIDDFLVASGEKCIQLETQYEAGRKRKNPKTPQISSTATIELESTTTGATTASTISSCRGRCGMQFEDPRSCQCDNLCKLGDTCCPDFDEECPGAGVTVTHSSIQTTKPIENIVTSSSKEVTGISTISSNTHRIETTPRKIFLLTTKGTFPKTLAHQTTMTLHKKTLTTKEIVTTTTKTSVESTTSKFKTTATGREAVTSLLTSTQVPPTPKSPMKQSSSDAALTHTTLFPGVPDSLGSSETLPKMNSWMVTLAIVTLFLITGAILSFWWHRRKKEANLPEDSDIRKLEEDTSIDDIPPEPYEDRVHSTSSYRPLDNNSYPQDNQGTPV